MAQRFDVSTPRKKSDGGTFWHRVGTAWASDKPGIFANVVFDSMPLPDAEGRVSVTLFEPRDQQSGGQRQQGSQRGGGRGFNDLDDDVPGF